MPNDRNYQVVVLFAKGKNTYYINGHKMKATSMKDAFSEYEGPKFKHILNPVPKPVINLN